MSEGAQTVRSPPKRKRRTASELRRDIVVAAQAVFSEKGYSATSIREIAARADAAGPLIFRHFQDKATLFATAVFEPIEKTLDENLSKADPYWVNLSPVERVRSYAELVIETFRQNKRLFIAYMNATVFHADEFSHLSEKFYPPSFESRIIQLERFSLENPAGSSFLLRDPHFEVRLILLLFCSVALFDDLFFKSSERDSEREMLGIVKLVSMGVGLEPGSVLASGQAPPAAASQAQPPSAPTAGDSHEMRRLISLKGQINNLFSAALQDLSQATASVSAEWPQIELMETDDGLRLTAQLAGVDQDDVQLSLQAGMLTLRGERRSRPDEVERADCGAFQRRIAVGEIDEKRVKASFDMGVLTVDLPHPRGARSASKRIRIDRQTPR